MKSAPVIEATLGAIARAHRDYERWSGGDWLWAAPEYMATTAIARALHGLDHVRYVTMENNAREAIEYAGGNLVGRPNSQLNLQGRFDLVVWNTQGPRGLIEVKTTVAGYAQLNTDVQTLKTALKKAPDVRWGLVAFFASFAHGVRKDAKARVADRTEEIARRASQEVGDEYTVAQRRCAGRPCDRQLQFAVHHALARPLPCGPNAASVGNGAHDRRTRCSVCRVCQLRPPDK
ncbi:MAG: hypothetical protein F4Y86_12930 [Gammaproteobacteria bacterium]|nr:hypothetical protein [Gammaproteobacteria bacterium]